MTGGVQGSGGRVQGAHVVRAMLLAVLATAVVPPVGARWLNHWRVSTTWERVRAAGAAAAGTPAGVVCGPGRLPDQDAGHSAVHALWVSSAVLDAASFGDGTATDAWGRCFLMNARWVLSAGPNGAIETPLNADALGGDDIGVRVR